MSIWHLRVQGRWDEKMSIYLWFDGFQQNGQFSGAWNHIVCWLEAINLSTCVNWGLHMTQILLKRLEWDTPECNINILKNHDFLENFDGKHTFLKGNYRELKKSKIHIYGIKGKGYPSICLFVRFLAYLRRINRLN